MRQRASSGFAAVGPNAGGPPPSGFAAAPVGGTTGGGGATRQPADRQLGGERSGGSDRGTT
jgi:hypothetical protein